MSEGFQIKKEVKQSTNSVSREYKASPCAKASSRTQTFCHLLVPWSAFLYDFLPTRYFSPHSSIYSFIVRGKEAFHFPHRLMVGTPTTPWTLDRYSHTVTAACTLLLSSDELDHQHNGQLLWHDILNLCIKKKVLEMFSRGTCPARKPW